MMFPGKISIKSCWQRLTLPERYKWAIPMHLASILTVTLSVSLFMPSRLMANPNIPHEVLESAAQNTLNLMEKYPQSGFFVLNLGITTTLTNAFLEHYISDSKKAALYFSEIPVTGLREIEQLGPNDLKRFFDNIIPPPEVLESRTLVINRVLWAGQTMEVFLPHLINYLQKHRPGTSVTYYWTVKELSTINVRQFHNMDPSGKILLPGKKIVNERIAKFYIDVIDAYRENRELLQNVQKHNELLPQEIANLPSGVKTLPEKQGKHLQGNIALTEYIKRHFSRNDCFGLTTHLLMRQ